MEGAMGLCTEHPQTPHRDFGGTGENSAERLVEPDSEQGPRFSQRRRAYGAAPGLPQPLGSVHSALGPRNQALKGKRKSLWPSDPKWGCSWTVPLVLGRGMCHSFIRSLTDSFTPLFLHLASFQIRGLTLKTSKNISWNYFSEILFFW